MTTSDRCMNCGLCNSTDPILAAIRKESASTRYKAVLVKQGKPNQVFFLCTDTGLQEAACPAGIKLGEEFRKMREKCVQQGISTKENEQMLDNFRKNGTPYETMDSEDWHDKPVW
jgi:Fe-S oxidoreductase